MSQLKCLNTCYMETGIKPKGRVKGATNPVVELFEDEDGGVYEVENNLVEAFINSGNFQQVVGSGKTGFQGGEIELSPAERTCLQTLLPKEASAASAGAILSLQAQLKTTGTAKTQPKTIDVGPEVLQIITAEFRELNDQGALPLGWLQTYQRFN